ncbi:MAG TPA: ThuA domain-containing protein, partial [Verrucomicrobiales bacterium]|nr:ThuA domain-containing protein [Verrucomicrobiales bacterium]
HAVINNPRWGWDGWIYATHGYSSSNRVVNAKGESMPSIGSGVVRFKPDGTAIEQYSSKGGNTWGLEITGDNRVMWTQPTSGTILEQVVLPEYALARGKWGNTASFNVVIGSPKSYPAMSWEQLAYVQIDLVGSFTAAAGCVIYDGGSWPAEYNGDYFTTEPTINIVHHERLTPKGSTYTGHKLPGREETEFIRSRDMWWRPIEVRVGPDGAVYVGDFYNQAVIHNDTRGPDHNKVNAAVRPDRDHYFGRIWRLDHKKAKKIAVPDLSKADTAALVQALEHPNRAVRMNASRLLLDRPNPVPPRTKLWMEGEPEQYAALMEKNYGYQSLLKLALDASKPAEARIAALWILGRRDSEDVMMLGFGWEKAFNDKDPVVLRNAAQISELPVKGIGVNLNNFLTGQLAALVTNADATVRLAALRSLGSASYNADIAKTIVTAWPKFDDDWQKSAAVGALAKNAAAAIAAILDSGDASLATLVSTLSQSIGEKNDADSAAKLVTALASKPASADALKRSILDTLGKSLKAEPPMTPELTTALTQLLSSGASGSALPLAAKWDKAGSLKGAMEALTKDLFAKLQQAGITDDDRFTAAQSLIGLRTANKEALPAVLGVVTGSTSPALKNRLITALSETDDASVGAALAAGFNKLPPDTQTIAFNMLLKRADWALALLDAVKAKQVDVAMLGPANAFRLRTHPDKAVSKRAGEMLDELMPGAKARAETIAKLVPEVEKRGDVEQGRLMFTATCALCHKFGNLPGAEVGPNLTGMGAHGAGELLTAIADPNAEVDPSFTAWNIETKDGQIFAGVIARENPASIYLKFQGGEKEIRTADIKTRVNTGRSLMPEGFEALPPDILRNIITFMQATDGGKFRTLDLRPAFTATTSLGLYASQDHKDESFVFRKSGTVTVEGIPFNIVPPEKAPQNIVVLKGGPPRSFAKTLPQRVEIKAGGFKANRLHFLGGVTGWGYSGNGEPSDVLKITVHTTKGQQESILCKNGVEFADYINRIEVPGSKYAPGLVRDHQLRWFSKQLPVGAVEIDHITLESVDGSAVPTIVAITAELADEKSAPLPAPAPVKKAAAIEWKAGTKVLLIGGGSSHDFQKFFNLADTAILNAAGGMSVNYTEDAVVAAKELANADVAVISTNQGSFSAQPFRAALKEFTDAGKGLVLLHPGLWYNFNDWAEYNKIYAGGGSRGHDRLGEFEVKVTQPQHPLLKGVSPSFKITDELYYYTVDPAGSAVDVLATATSATKGTFPQVFTVKHPKAKIVGITLGHDARAHDLPEYKTLLVNAVKWVSSK